MKSETTIKGRQVWPLEPSPDDVDLETIAGVLANICRFGGHCRPFYSAAQHSVMVTRCVTEMYDKEFPGVPKDSEVRRKLRLKSLLLDGPERKVVLLVTKVARAFFLPTEPFAFHDVRLPGPGVSKAVLVLPHPSGRCRVWNEPDSVRRARDCFDELRED